jgi:hypothetical protein
MNEKTLIHGNFFLDTPKVRVYIGLKRWQKINKPRSQGKLAKEASMKEWIIKIKSGNDVRIDKMKSESQFAAEKYWKDRGEKKVQAIPYSKGGLEAVLRAAKQDYNKVILAPAVSMEI